MRRAFAIAAALSATAFAAPAESPPPFAEVREETVLRFPADHGAHPLFRTEWWYVTGWLDRQEGGPLGFQITFFRARPEREESGPSAFEPDQILFAHAALSDPAIGALVHDSRAARAGFGIAEAAEGEMDLRLLDWRMGRGAGGVIEAAIPAGDFTLDLSFTPTQPPMLNGEAGFSQKGPERTQASHYYSLPQLRVGGSIRRTDGAESVTGIAWLDREWSTTLLPDLAVGWDWTGLNLDDGSALMAFRVRRADGTSLYAGGTWRAADGETTSLSPGDIDFRPRRWWRSAETGARYPVEVELAVRLPGGVRRFVLKPLFDAQEFDGRSSGMPVYWEGAVSVDGGRGYLELTGYDEQ